MNRLLSTSSFSAFLLMLCLFGNGCCTKYVSEVCHASFGNDSFLLERQLEFSNEDVAYNFKYETKKKRHYIPKTLCSISVKTHKRRVVKLPLDTPPPKARICKIYVNTNKHAKKAEQVQFNFVNPKRNNSLGIRSVRPFRMAYFIGPKGINIKKNSDVYLKLNEDDLPMLLKPFVLVDFQREDYPLSETPKPWKKKNERYNLMIPYKKVGDCYYAYVAPKVDSWMLDKGRSNKYESNIVTMLSTTILGIPAVVIDIVLLPFTWPSWTN